MNLHHALQKYFGYSSFHPLQEEIITDILAKKDVFALMPTGGGKSLCFQLPSLLEEGITVVISPLIALMKDQVDSLNHNGIPAAFINSSLQFDEIQKVQKELLRNKIKLLYVAPERIMLPNFIPFLQKLNIELFAIDEAHCISEWGHDFRPEYRRLITLRTTFPTVPIAAFTATAIPEVQKDIISQLHLHSSQPYVASFNRKNLFYKILPKMSAKESYKQLITILHQHKNESGIIYCFSRDATEKLASKLQDDGFRALPYHAGLDAETRTLHQEKFIREDVEIIVATIAFGMGINKSNVRLVIHYNLPKSLESYYQETGRAGRDGLPSECILFYSYSDKIKIEHFVDEKEDAREREIARNKLQEIINFCESKECRRKLLLEYFGEHFDEINCVSCDNCLAPKETFDGTTVAQKILSCVARIEERFGTQYVVDVLRGSESQRILSNKHNVLSTYGIGKEYSSKQWLKFIRELVQLGFLDREEQYSVLKLNDKSRDILFRQDKVMLTKPMKEEILVQIAATTDEHFEAQLFELLRALRKQLADSERVPPYVIFHDTTLKEMATVLPTDELHLQTITGIGERKLKKYGKQFLDLIKDYVSKKDKLSLSLENKSPNNATTSKTYSVDEVRKSLPRAYEKWTEDDVKKLIAEYRLGRSTIELAKAFGRNKGAIASRLKKLGLIS